MRILFAFVLLFFSNVLIAQTTYEFLKLDPSPRAAALAGSYVSNMDDPNVIFYNPAGIKSLEGNPVSFSFLKHLVDINSASLAYSQEFEGIGRFGAAVQYINYGEFDETDQFGYKTGTFGVNEMAFIVGYANTFEEDFYYGANIKLIYSGIADQSSVGLGVDIGIQYLWQEYGWRFGFSIVNIGSQLSSYFDVEEELPVDVRLGFSKKLQYMPLEFFFSFNNLNDDNEDFFGRLGNITAGGEFSLGKVIKLRFGYDNEKRKDLKLGSTTGLAGFNIGLGIIVQNYKVDYAFSSLGSIGAMHRLGVSTSL